MASCEACSTDLGHSKHKRNNTNTKNNEKKYLPIISPLLLDHSTATQYHTTQRREARSHQSPINRSSTILSSSIVILVRRACVPTSLPLLPFGHRSPTHPSSPDWLLREIHAEIAIECFSLDMRAMTKKNTLFSSPYPKVAQRSSGYQFSGHQSFRLLVPLGLAGLSPFRPPGTLRTAGTSLFGPPGTLMAGGTQSFQPPTYPGDWRDSALSGPQVLLWESNGVTRQQIPSGKQ